MPSSTSPNMVLFLPVPGSTAGPQWASETTSNWSTVDTHDHTAGKGVQIPIAALNVNADFSWLTFGQTNIGYAAFTDKLATGNLTVNQSLGNVAGDPYWRNASGVVKKLSLAGDALTIPSGTSLLGSLLMTGIAAPSSPSAGFGSFYFDSTATNIAVKNSAGVVKHGVQTKAAVGSQWLTSIADDGSSVLAQPAFADISGSLAIGQIPNSLVTYAKIQNVSATARLLGRKTAGAGVIEELSASDAGALGVGCAILDTQSLTAQGTLTTASWTANQWSRIEIELFGISNAGTPANSDIRWRANADSSAKYGSSVQAWTSTPTVTQDVVGTATSAQVASLNTTHTQFICGLIRIFPKTASSRLRAGSSEFTTIPNSATNSEYFVTRGGFIWADSATDMTFATIIFGSSATFTGTMIVRGYL